MGKPEGYRKAILKMRLAEQEKQQTKFMYERMSAKEKELDKAQNTDELQQKIADLEAKIAAQGKQVESLRAGVELRRLAR